MKKAEKKMKKVVESLSFGDNIQKAAKQMMKDYDVESLLLVATKGDGVAACVVECHGNERDYKMLESGTHGALEALKEEVAEARRKAGVDDEEEDEREEDDEESDEVDDLKFKLMMALHKRKVLGKDGLPKKKALDELSEKVLKKKTFHPVDLMNLLAGEVLTASEVEILKKAADEEEEDEDDEDED